MEGTERENYVPLRGADREKFYRFHTFWHVF